METENACLECIAVKESGSDPHLVAPWCTGGAAETLARMEDANKTHPAQLPPPLFGPVPTGEKHQRSKRAAQHRLRAHTVTPSPPPSPSLILLPQSKGHSFIPSCFLGDIALSLASSLSFLHFHINILLFLYLICFFLGGGGAPSLTVHYPNQIQQLNNRSLPLRKLFKKKRRRRNGTHLHMRPVN